jgi:pimeloyl-ACP methyl ester carboxylesterase
MAIDNKDPIEEEVMLANTRVKLRKSGTGDPLLILHDEMGNSNWLQFQKQLSGNHTIYSISHPGCLGSDQPEWIMNMRDLAGWYLQAIDELAISPVNVLGLSIGGWIAAEMAVMCPTIFNKMILVGAAGIKPDEGEIFDMFSVTADVFQRNCFFNPPSVPEYQIVCPDDVSEELAIEWEYARESTCRVSWKPYMYYAGLPNLLDRIKNLETLIIWGDNDQIVPLNSGKIYEKNISKSILKIVKNCGHRPEIEKPDEFVRLVSEFLK